MKIKTAILAGLLSTASVSLPASAAAPVRMQVWEITRTSWTPSKFAITLSVGYSDSRAFLGLTYLRRTGTGLKVLPGAHLFSHEGTSTPQVYAQGERVSCATVSACSPTKGIIVTIATYEDAGRSDPVAPDTILAMTYGRDAKVTIDSNAGQWRVRRVARTVRAVWSSDSDSAAGVWTSDLGFEAFTGASVKGGARGSVAIGVPPCAKTPAVPAAAGAGTVRLTGGVAPVEASCPTDVYRPSQVARKATTWQLSGPVVGLTAEQVSEPGTVRLVVVDF